MVLEGLLLLAGLIVLWFSDPASLSSLVILGVVVLLFLPTIPLIIQQGPPFVPTKGRTVDEMIALAGIKHGERVYDLGCGDGRLLIAAAKKGAHAIGYELSLPTLLLAKWRTRTYKHISVQYGDFWKKSYRDADVIVCYLLISKMKEFEERIWPKLKKGTRVVSHSFTMPTVKPAKRKGNAVLYIKT